MSCINRDHLSGQSLYEGVLLEGMVFGEGYTSIKFNKSIVCPKELGEVIGESLEERIRQIWAKTSVDSCQFDDFDEFWSRNVSRVKDRGWCYGLSYSFLIALMNQPDGSVHDLMWKVDLGEALVYQASQALSRGLVDRGGIPRMSRGEIDSFLLQPQIPGVIDPIFAEVLEPEKISKDTLKRLSKTLTQCLEDPDCVAARISVSGFPGHSVVCQFHPTLRIFDPASGIFEIEDTDEFSQMLAQGLASTIEQRRSDGVAEFEVTIVGYYSE